MDIGVGKVFLDQKITPKNYKMRNILYLVVFVFMSCNGQSKKLIDNNQKKKSNLIQALEGELDNLLYCDKFDIREGYYQIPDNGCLYNVHKNSLGNANVVIIPKTELFQTTLIDSKCLDDIDCINKTYAKIFNLTVNEFKNNFDAVIFIENKKYLKKIPHLDTSYNPQIPFVIDAYILRDNYWNQSSKFEVNNEKDFNKIYNWEKKIINEKIREVTIKKIDQNTQQINNSFNQKWIGDYFTKLSYGQIQGIYTNLLINIKITKDSIIASGEGNQISFKDLLSVKENNNKLILNQLKNLSGYDVGKTMNPEFTLIEDGGKYYIQSKWIDSEIITKPKKLGYEIKKVK
jgi:hypothetical protein